ncbi:MAG: NAD(P)-dependent oxidoreductase [Chloroflexota bacterium]
MRVAVSGAGGRLGRALVAALADAPFSGPAGPIAWTRAELNLERPEAITGLLAADRVDVLIHAAAWTDVDACALDPERALRLNASAVGTIALASAALGLDLVLISTNEVFDGARDDGRGYRIDDETRPVNAYGASKLAGERAALDAYAAAGRSSLGIVRSAWLYGPPGNDFPDKIVRAAERARSTGQPLRLVADEVGTPTRTGDLAEAIVELIAEDALAGIHHLVNGGAVSRAGWARELLDRRRIEVEIEEVPGDTWERPSRPPRWGVLEPTPLPSGIPMRPWLEALADDLAERRSLPSGVAAS